MKVISTNISVPKEFEWNGKTETTGIFKEPLNDGVYLGKHGVEKDHVADLIHHGGTTKACYLYSFDHYDYWKGEYPNLDWEYGFFGENLTVEGLDEATIKIGDVFQLGETVVQVTEPRTPCYKLGVRFNDQGIIKDFLDVQFCGVYVKVLTEGRVSRNDSMKLIESKGKFTMKEVYSLYGPERNNLELAKQVIEDPYLAESCKNSLRKRFKL